MSAPVSAMMTSPTPVLIAGIVTIRSRAPRNASITTSIRAVSSSTARLRWSIRSRCNRARNAWCSVTPPVNASVNAGILTRSREPELSRIPEHVAGAQSACPAGCLRLGSQHAAATHPGQSNCMAATAGIATPLGQHTANDNIFHQVETSGGTWKEYAESMPSNCAPSSGFYRIGNNPPFWYDDLKTAVGGQTCSTQDVPFTELDADLATGNMPTFAWITPNECNNMRWTTGC